MDSRQAFRARLVDLKACRVIAGHGIQWVDSLPDATPQELWSQCPNPDDMLWLLDAAKLEYDDDYNKQVVDAVEDFALQIYGRREVRRALLDESSLEITEASFEALTLWDIYELLRAKHIERLESEILFDLMVSIRGFEFLGSTDAINVLRDIMDIKEEEARLCDALRAAVDWPRIVVGLFHPAT